ncbi:MAG: restriction endonuclease [bacterium]|nr:restriction endonuclease [bacterium]
MSRSLTITKADGIEAPYRREQLMESLIRSGASAPTAEKIAAAVEAQLLPGMSTRKIWTMAHQLLRRVERASALRYGLKRAIMNLGPTGFPFEKYLAAVLKAYGYDVSVGVVVPGACVSHEIDVIARKDREHYLIEAKYHNQPGLRSDVKVALYVHARFLDICANWASRPEHAGEFHQAWLVTNTKCTRDAVQYAECAGLKVLSWRHPSSGGLEKMIEDKALYPITILPLHGAIKTKLVAANVMLVKDLCDSNLKELSLQWNIPLGDLERLRALASRMCG